MAPRAHGPKDPALWRLLEQVVELAPDGVQIVDLDGRIIYSNRAVEEIYGYSAEELRGKHVDELNADPELAQTTILPSIRAQGRWAGEVLVKHKDGRLFPIALSTSLVDDGKGNPLAMVGLLSDISDKKRGEAALFERKRLAELSAAVSLALVHDDPIDVILQRCTDAVVKYLDGAFARIWTLDEDEATLRLRASSGRYTGLEGTHSRIAIGETKIGIIARERHPTLTNDVLSDPNVLDKDWARAERLVSFAGYPLLVEGRVAGVIAMFSRHALTDVTLQAMASVANALALGIVRKNAQRARDESEERFRSAFDEGPLGMAISQADHRLSRVNSSLCNTLGYPEEHLLGRTFADLVHPEDRDPELERMGGLLDGETKQFRTEKRFVHANGSLPWLRLTASRLQVNPHQARWCLTMLEDITVQRQAEVALREAKERAEATDRIKSEFLDIASHELRTPLNALSLNLQLARSRVAKGAAVTSSALDRMLHQVQLMATMVGDLIDTSRLERGALAIRPVTLDLVPLVSATVEDFKQQAPSRPISFVHPSGPVFVTVDAARVEQVVANLLDNAFKYSPESAPVSIQLAPNGRYVRVEVSDRGPGVPKELQERLFTRFFRVTSRTTSEQPGLGLGLYICRVIVELHGGKMGVESEVDAGSTFHFELPLSNGKSLSKGGS